MNPELRPPSLTRNAVSHLENDRILSTDIDTIKQLMQSGKILEAVENKVGRLR
jgi:hypothetical protein